MNREDTLSERGRRDKTMKITMTKEGSVPVCGQSTGIFFEDLNYALDGGLYAELLENRNFEAKDAHGKIGDFTAKNDGSYAWSVFPAGSDVALKVKDDRPLFVENPHYLRIVARTPGSGVANKAYDGIFLKKGDALHLALYMRSYDYRGTVTAGVREGETAVFSVRCKARPDGQWHKYSFRVKAKADCKGAPFFFTLDRPGSVHLDSVSLMPEDAVLGVFRRDLVRLLKELRPGFVRFPGGCIVEGNNLANRYRWKLSVGQKERRRQNWSRWAVHGAGDTGDFHSPFSHYGQTLGIGFYEYFCLCEYLSAKPLPVVSLGIACQYMSKEAVAIDDPELETYIQDALDVVEFANGGRDTVWGRVRAEMGHPEPFGLEYLGLGNEQWETPESDFYRRFEIFSARVHEKYPDIKIIGTVGPDVETPRHKEAWEWTRANLARDPKFVYAADEHFYVPPQWMYDHVTMYDGYPRTGKVYAGEYACHVPGVAASCTPQANVWEAALAEAAFMTGMERNADIVVMKSYAPLFARIGYAQWSPDLIWFDAEKAFGSASYYVQKMYSLLTGEVSYRTTSDEKGVYASATSSGDLTYVKAVNATDEPFTAEIGADFDFGELLRIVQMRGELTDYNSLAQPEKLVPVEVAPTSARTVQLPPRSFSVLVFRK